MNTEIMTSWPSLILSLVGVVASVLLGRTAYQLSALAELIEKEAKTTEAHRESVRKQLEECKLAITEIGAKVGVNVSARFKE